MKLHLLPHKISWPHMLLQPQCIAAMLVTVMVQNWTVSNGKMFISTLMKIHELILKLYLLGMLQVVFKSAPVLGIYSLIFTFREWVILFGRFYVFLWLWIYVYCWCKSCNRTINTYFSYPTDLNLIWNISLKQALSPLLLQSSFGCYILSPLMWCNI
jgi:hypothetical protein